MFSKLRTATLALLATTVTLTSAQQSTSFTITSPSSDIFWVAQSDNVISWVGTPPSPQFSVFIANPNIQLLTDRTALVSALDGFRGSYLLNPGLVPAGTGYTIQLTDLLNNTNIYAESQSFEIKPVGSTYPTATPSGASGTPATASQSGSQTAAGSVTGSAAPSASTSSASNGAGAVEPGKQLLRWGPVLVGVLGALSQ